jgi:hypothetical protein
MRPVAAISQVNKTRHRTSGATCIDSLNEAFDGRDLDLVSTRGIRVEEREVLK